MANIKKKLGGFYNLLADRDEGMAPIYKGPIRKDLVLDINEHSKIVSRLLASPARREPASPGPAGDIHGDDIDEMLKFKPTLKKTVQSTRLKVIQSLFVLTGYFTLGMWLVLMETELAALQKVTAHHDSSYLGQSYLLLARTSAAAVGAIVAGLLVDRVNDWVMMSICMFTLGASTLSLPFCTESDPLMIILTASCGLFMGFYANGGNLTILRVWGNKHGSWIQMLYFMYASGCLITQWIIKPFLNQGQDYAPIKAVADSDYLFVIERTSSSPTQDDQYLFIINEAHKKSREYEFSETRKEWLSHNTLKATTTYQSPVIAKSEASIPFAFIITAIPIFYVAFSCLFMAFYTIFIARNQEISFDGVEVEKLKETENIKKYNSNIFIILISFLLFIFYFVFCTVQITYGHFVSNFAEAILGWPHHQADMITLVFWTLLTAGSFIGVLLIRVLRPQRLLSTSVTLMLVSVLPLVFISKSHVLLWVVTSSLALSSSVVFATGITWTYQYMSVSGLVGAIFVVSSVAAQLFVPTVGSLCLKSFGQMSFVYVLEAATFTLIFVYCALQIIVSKNTRIPQQEEDCQEGDY